MQNLYNLLYQLSVNIKGRMGYAFTIQQAKLAAYFAFLIGGFAVLTALIQTLYVALASFDQGLFAPAIAFFPSAQLVGGVTTAYIGALAYKKAQAYVNKAWQAWMNNNAM